MRIDISRDDLPTLTKRFRALERIVAAKTAQVRRLQDELADLRAKTDPSLLESERHANAILTEEIEHLRAAKPCAHLFEARPVTPGSAYSPYEGVCVKCGFKPTRAYYVQQDGGDAKDGLTYVMPTMQTVLEAPNLWGQIYLAGRWLGGVSHADAMACADEAVQAHGNDRCGSMVDLKTALEDVYGDAAQGDGDVSNGKCEKCRAELQVFGGRWCADCYYPGIGEDQQRYRDLLEEGYSRYQARLMVGWADPPDDEGASDGR